MQSLRAVQPMVESSKVVMRRTQQIVEAIGRIYFKGNILPFSWLQHPSLCNTSGKVNLPATIILADIVSWYRPREIREEGTGRVVEMRRRFKADKLQKSYQAWADLFGLTKRQVKDAVAFLREQGLITTEFRHIRTEGGLALSNVLFVEPVVAKIESISALNLVEDDGRGM
jgi:hypothetical protein